MTSEKPQGVELPDFKTEEPFFTSWSTTMVADGKLWVAVDRTSKQGRWDQLYIDSNVNCHLNDEKPVKAYRTDQYYTYFGFIRLMRRWTKQIRALELFGEKNRLGRGSNLGQAGGNLCLWGPERFFSIVRNAQYTYPLFGRAKNCHCEEAVLRPTWQSQNHPPSSLRRN